MKKSKFKIETACWHDSETADVSFQKNRGNFNVYFIHSENDNFLIDLLIQIFFPDTGVPAEFFKIDVEQLGLKIIWRVASILFSLHCHSGKF